MIEIMDSQGRLLGVYNHIIPGPLLAPSLLLVGHETNSSLLPYASTAVICLPTRGQETTVSET